MLRNLIYAPLSHRRAVLESIIKTKYRKCCLSESTKFLIPPSPWNMNSFSRLHALFSKTIEEGKEGLMIKGLNSVYMPGKRSNWMKVKPDYMAGLGDSGEYIIIGAMFDPRNTFLAVSSELCNRMNTFFVAAIVNDEDVRIRGAIPKVKCLFHLQCGFSCEGLIQFSSNLVPNRIKVNFKAKPIRISEDLPYTIINASDWGDMQFALKEPITVTLKGSSYVESGGVWILRHPRLVQECSLDRPWKEFTVTYRELQEFGEYAITPPADALMHLETTLVRLDENYLCNGKWELLEEAIHKNKKAKVTATVTDWPHSCQTLRPDVDLLNCFVYSGVYSGNTIGEEDNLNSRRFKGPMPFLEKVGWVCTSKKPCSIQHIRGVMFVDPSETESVVSKLELYLPTTKCALANTVLVIDKSCLSRFSGTAIPFVYVLAEI